MDNRFKIKIPRGYLMVEEKGAEDEYPGVFISFSKDGVFGYMNDIVACVGYDTCSKEIKTEVYKDGYDDEPVNIICYTDGRDIM